jgi:hypothetical protein
MSDHDAHAHGSEPPLHDSEAPVDLQFDEAELATPTASWPVCQLCQQPIVDNYFETNGKILCGACRQRVEAAFRGGSPLGRVIKATVFGTGAAVAGAILYFVVSRMTGLNLGIISVLVGFMVGAAVRKGTGGRGGRFYQILAVFLCYSAIGAMNFAYAMLAVAQMNDPKAPQAAAVEIAAQPNAAPAGNTVKPPAAAQDPKPFNLGQFLLLLLRAIYEGPVIVAYYAPISGLIYCFALWEAWKINKGAQLSIAGPFRVSQLAGGTSEMGVAGDGA